VHPKLDKSINSNFIYKQHGAPPPFLFKEKARKVVNIYEIFDRSDAIKRVEPDQIRNLMYVIPTYIRT
jgi:hypothetical protein